MKYVHCAYMNKSSRGNLQTYLHSCCVWKCAIQDGWCQLNYVAISQRCNIRTIKCVCTLHTLHTQMLLPLRALTRPIQFHNVAHLLNANTPCRLNFGCQAWIFGIFFPFCRDWMLQVIVKKRNQNGVEGFFFRSVLATQIAPQPSEPQHLLYLNFFTLWWEYQDLFLYFVTQMTFIRWINWLNWFSEMTKNIKHQKKDAYSDR